MKGRSVSNKGRWSGKPRRSTDRRLIDISKLDRKSEAQGDFGILWKVEKSFQIRSRKAGKGNCSEKRNSTFTVSVTVKNQEFAIKSKVTASYPRRGARSRRKKETNEVAARSRPRTQSGSR
jgi:hypothetical protein